MKRLFVLLISVFVAATSIAAEERRVVVPVNVSLFPFYGFSSSVTVVNNVQLNIGVGYADELDGVATGVVSIIGQDVRGTQTNVVNVAGGPVHGAQIGVVNLSGGDVRGTQVGVFNGSLGTFVGPQIAVVNLAKESREQVGVVNASADASGVQVGVVNVAGKHTGVPIGLVSVVLVGGRTHAQSWIDETGMVTAALIHGAKRMYNIYTVSATPTLETVSAGLGLGAHFNGRRSWSRTEVLASSVNRADDLWQAPAGLFRARGYTGYRIGPVSLIAGVSFTYLMDLSNVASGIAPFHGYELPFSTQRHRFWPGVFAGVQL